MMGHSPVGSRAPKSVQLSYQLLRNVTSPDELLTGVKSFIVNLPVSEVLKLGTEANLRGYIAEYNVRRRNRVHVAIRNTILEEPERFITRNSGFVITASDADVDDGAKTIRLKDASILNGSQSQGEIRRWSEEAYDDGPPLGVEDTPFFVRAEIIVDPDPAEVVETAVARNTSTQVGSIQVAAARRQLDDLEASIKTRFPEARIRRRDDEPEDDNVYDPRRVLQYARLLMPTAVSKNESASEQLRAYKNPEQCLTEFTRWYDNKRDSESKLRYEFSVCIAPAAIEEYRHWEGHEEWNGHNVWERTKKGGRACRRDPKTGKINWVSPGLVFPILGAMSEFVQEESTSRWKIIKPSIFSEAEMIKQAVAQFRNVDSDPMQMGRSGGVYDALRIYPRTLSVVLRDVERKSAVR